LGGVILILRERNTIAGWDYEQISPPFADTRVDRLDGDATGQIDRLAALTLDIPDTDIIRNLNARIEDSRTYWDLPEGYNLRESRNENMRLFLGKQIDVSHLYRFQVPYVENEIFLALETIVSYLTTQNSQPEVYPAQDSDRSKLLAIDLEKALMAHSERFQLNRLVETCVRNLFTKRLGCIYFHFDKHYGKNGEIIPIAVDPEHLILDKNATLGSNPAFICHLLKYSVEELIFEYPDKKDDIYKALGIVRGTPKQMTQEVAIRRVWLTHYDKGKPVEACVTYFGKTVLAKYKNPNWLYNSENFLEMPEKPFIFLNYINDGNHLIDMTTPVEQAANMQNILNKRGRQIMENADKANGVLIISTDSGLTKDDAQNLTGDPNQKLIIKTNGQHVSDLVYQVPPHQLPSYVMDDKLDQRMTVLNLMGTPTEFTGADSNEPGSSEKTLGQSMMAKNQASGRQDLVGRSIDRFMDHYYNFLTQMMVTWYNENHYFVYNGGDGEFDYITMKRNLIEDGIAVTVKSGTTLPFDKQRQEAIALQLAKMGMIDPYNLFKDLHMDNPQKRYDSWFKWKTDPSSLSRNVDDAMSESSAYVDYVEIMNGKEAKPRDDASQEHILTHRKQMLTDDFLKAKRSIQNKLLTHIEKELSSLELRTSLDEMSQEGPQMLDPKIPIQPPPPPMPQPQPMMPGGQISQPGAPPPPGMMPPGSPPQMPPPPQPPGQPGMIPGGLPPQPGPPGVMAGAGLTNPANPRIQGPQNLTALPTL
jgi:hypothetical protein